MTAPEDVKITFPCDYPIKAIGDNHIDLKALVFETVKEFAPDISEARMTLNPSKKGTFVSVRFYIMATGEDQLEAIHKALKATGHVKMVI